MALPDITKSRLQVLGAAVFFSTGGVGIKLTSLSALEVAGARSAVAALVLWLLLPSWRRFWRPRSMLVGVAYAATLVLFTVATKYTMAANAIFLQSTAPIYILILAPWLLGESNRRSDYLMTLWLMVGLGLFFIGSDPATDSAPDPAFGNGVAISSGMALALVLMGLRWLARADAKARARPNADVREDAAGAAALAGNVFAALICAPMILPMSAVSATDLALVAYLGSIQIGLGYWTLTRGIDGVPAIEVSLLMLAEPVLNAVWAWLVLGERPGAWSLAGCIVIMAATCARVALHRADERALDLHREL